ncbi:unnamed protein product, partial [Mesorhabditis spiculigera]
MTGSENGDISLTPDDEIKEESLLDDDEVLDENDHGDDVPCITQEEFFERHGGDPKKLDLSRAVLVSNLPSDFMGDDYAVFNEALLEMLSSDFKVSRDNIDAVIRVPKLKKDASDQENALCALISFKTKVHKHRMIAQKKVAEEKSALSLSSVDEIPQDWFDADLLTLTDEVGGADEDGGENKSNKEDKKGNKDKAKPDPEAEKQRLKEEREAFVKRYEEDNDDDVAYTTNWDGAPEFQWKICAGKNDHRKVILENIHLTDLRDPFLYRAIAKAESVDVEIPQRYSFDGTKAHKGKVTITFSRDHLVMPSAMRSLIYIRSPHKRRIKIYLPQHETTLKSKDDFEKRLGRVIEETLSMRQLIVKVLPETFELTLEKAKEWFSDFNVESAEAVKDGRGQNVALVTFATTTDAMDAHQNQHFISIDDTKCQIFLMSIEVNKNYLSVFDKAAETAVYQAKMTKRNEEERKEREKRSIKRRADDHPNDKRARWENTTRSPRGAAPRGTRGGRARGRGAPLANSRPVARAPIPRTYETTSSYTRREDPYRSTERHREPYSRSAFEPTTRSAFATYGDIGGSSYSTYSQSAFDFGRSTASNPAFSDKRRYY